MELKITVVYKIQMIIEPLLAEEMNI